MLPALRCILGGRSMVYLNIAFNPFALLCYMARVIILPSVSILPYFYHNFPMPCSVPDVSLPMNETVNDVVQGSMSGTMTSGAALVAAQVGNWLYTDGQTGHVSYGNHYTECCHIPDVCTQGVTFAMWIKRGIGTGRGIVLHTGGYERNSKGIYNESIPRETTQFCSYKPAYSLQRIHPRWQYTGARFTNMEPRIDNWLHPYVEWNYLSNPKLLFLALVKSSVGFTSTR